jgi:hypothetical protein
MGPETKLVVILTVCIILTEVMLILVKIWPNKIWPNSVKPIPSINFGINQLPLFFKLDRLNKKLFFLFRRSSFKKNE